MSDLKRCTVITTIQPPTEAVRKFSAVKGSRLVVAGDRKTPSPWRFANTDYLSPAAQEKLGFRVTKALPWNHYCRKMTAYLYAARNGAEVIADTDDDNIPLKNWAFPSFSGVFDKVSAKPGYVNVYKLFTKQHIWPRGLPLDLVKAPQPALRVARAQAEVGAWQGLADEDPDVDAIYRLTINTPCYFGARRPLVLARGVLSPFNSQNTFFRRELFPLLYLPAFVTFRFTDILRGLVAQPVMWAAGYLLGFTTATVVQKRNPHDYMKDFESELPCYRHCAELPGLAAAAVKAGRSVACNLQAAYAALHKHGIVEARELRLLDAWLKDIA